MPSRREFMHRAAALCCSALPLADRKAPTTMIQVEHYQALKDALIPGDVVFAFCARNPDPLEVEKIMKERAQQPGGAPQSMRSFHTFFDESRFAERVAALNAIHDSRVRQSVCLSSIEDLRANLKRLPKDVKGILYNMEPQMTPREEMMDAGASVVAFAKVCHENGLNLTWVPGGFRMFEDEAKLSAIAPSIDAIVLQQQHELQQQGVNEFVALTGRRTALLKKLNPKCEVNVQVVIGRGSKEDLVKALKAVVPTVDGFILWTMKDTDTLKEILAAVR